MEHKTKVLTPTKQMNRPWFRSNTGILAGVCEGLANRFDVNPWTIRIAWLIAVLALGVGLMAYIILAISLPREDRLTEAHQKRFLGVCHRLSESTEIDVGLVRAGTLFLALTSFGITVVGYFILHVLLPEDGRRSNSQFV